MATNQGVGRSNRSGRTNKSMACRLIPASHFSFYASWVNPWVNQKFARRLNRLQQFPQPQSLKLFRCPLSHGACNKTRKPRAFASAVASNRAQKAMNPPSALAPLQVCPLRYRRHLTTAPFAKSTSPRACGSLSARARVVGESAEGIKPPSASALAVRRLLEQWIAWKCCGLTQCRKALSAAPAVCVAVSNITASYAKRKRR